MALPAGVTTATVTVGVPVTHTGGEVKTFVSIEPSAFLVHAATGIPLVDFLEELSIAEGVAGQFTLPHTDQAGFTDENGNAYTNWYYTARITYSTPSKAKNKAPKIKVFQLTTGQTNVDMDRLPGGAPALPYTAPTATVDAFNGRTGAVTFGESDLPSRLADAALDTKVLGLVTPAFIQRDIAYARTICLGDSIEAGARDGITNHAEDPGLSWFSLACILSGQRMRFYRNAGVPGNTTTQMLARLQADVLAHNPDVCVIGGPTNDHGANMTEEETRANYAAIVAALRAAGVTPVFRTAVPVGNPNKYKIERHNAWLADWAALQGISVLDVYTPLVDPLTGGQQAALTTDGIHPNAAGRLAIAMHVAATLPAFFRGSVPLTGNQSDATNLVTGGTFAVDTDANGYADGFVLGGGTFTPSLVTDATIVGKWQQSSIATTGLGYWQQQITTGWAVGDKLAVSALVDKPAGTSASLKLAFNTGAPINALLDVAGALPKGVLWAVGVVPAGATTLHARVSMNAGVGSVKIARLTVLNLTALGIA